jgi:hypothetical protein
MRYNTKYYNRRTKNLFKSRKKNQQGKRKKGKTSKGRRKRKSASRKFRRSRVKKKNMIGGYQYHIPNNINAGSKVKFIDIDSQNDPKPQLEGWIEKREAPQDRLEREEGDNDVLYHINTDPEYPGQNYKVEPSNITWLIYNHDGHGNWNEIHDVPSKYEKYSTNELSTNDWWADYPPEEEEVVAPWVIYP